MLAWSLNGIRAVVAGAGRHWLGERLLHVSSWLAPSVAIINGRGYRKLRETA